MPLMMGDWIRGTRGMKADVKGVYIGLLIHQYDHGHLPADLETLALIEPQVGSVWVSLSDKFPEVEPGKRKNLKLEEVRAFWNKQANNGEKGGRPKKKNPKHNPKGNPNSIPNHNHHNDIDLDDDSVLNQYKEWTNLIIDGNDQIFETMLMNEQIPTSENLMLWVKDHLGLLERYPKMRPTSQKRFRGSCLKHLRENYKKQFQAHGKGNKFTNNTDQLVRAHQERWGK